MSPGGGTISPLQASHGGPFHHSKRPTRDNSITQNVPRGTISPFQASHEGPLTTQNVPRGTISPLRTSPGGGGDSTAPNVSRGTISPPKTSLGDHFTAPNVSQGNISPPQTSLGRPFHSSKRLRRGHFTAQTVPWGTILPFIAAFALSPDFRQTKEEDIRIEESAIFV